MEDPPGAGGETLRITYRLAGQMVAVRVKSGGSSTLCYTYSDHLGSVVALSTTAGGLVNDPPPTQPSPDLRGFGNPFIML